MAIPQWITKWIQQEDEGIEYTADATDIQDTVSSWVEAHRPLVQALSTLQRRQEEYRLIALANLDSVNRRLVQDTLSHRDTDDTPV